MKQSLGRGLGDLMPPGDADSASAEGHGETGRGMDRLFQGTTQLEFGESSAPIPSSGKTREDVLAASQVPSWIFYLGDVFLMSIVIWMIAFSPDPMTRRESLVCLSLVILAAAIGIWPWMRNVLYCQSLGESDQLPEWAVAEDVSVGDERKTLVIHLRQPQMAVEVTETAWDVVNTKPFWIAGAPNLPPGGVRELLDRAAAYYREWSSGRPKKPARRTGDPLESPNG